MTWNKKGLEIGEITTVQTYMRLSLSRNYFEYYAHARELNIQSHTANYIHTRDACAQQVK
ncbi:hypothetical protein NQ318_011286 [Aromia moschata]|uniref:Uncharacterized protein n=1 Tax=Aromia moschata TaxID=1265417 RepID=A0AAV8X4W3_9CUCU|nr:hypothetical protein NQ318_011286 [Aromia moschata]